MRRFFMLGLLLVAGATGPRAENKPGDWLNPYHLEDTIVVTANRFATPTRQVASSVTVITAEEIERSQATSVTELLRTVPGLDVVQSGGTGQQTSLFLRGTNAEHVLVLVDGVKINDPSSPSNAVNLANLAADNIDRIEILRGPQSVLYGSDAIGGVVQIFTRLGTGKPELGLSAEAGSLNTYSELLTLRAGNERLDYSVAASRQSTDGISATYGPGKLEKDGYNNTTASAAVGYRPSSRFQLRLTGRLVQSDTDLDQASGVLDDPNYTMDSKEQFASLRVEHDLSREVWKQQFGAYVTHYERSTQDGFDPDHPTDSNDTHYDGLRTKYDWQLAAALGPTTRMTIAAETETEHLDQSLFFGSAWGPYSSALEGVDARTYAVSAMAQVGYGENLSVTLGGRRDHHDEFGGHSTYRVTGLYRFDDPGLTIKANYGSGFKAPSLYQIYDPGTGNPDLEPENSRGGEVGVDFRPNGSLVSKGITYFQTRFDDLIQYQSATGHMGNVARARTRGVEYYLSLDFRKTRLHYSYTYTEAVDRSSGQALLRRPRNKMSVLVEQQIVSSLLVRGDLIYVAKREDMDYTVWPYQRVSLDNYTVVSLAGAYTVREGIKLTARVNNLFDEEYAEALTFNCNPRTVSFGVEATF
jgi:vitamin B12 transporter